MAKGILGRKIGMAQIWNEDGKLLPVSVIEAGPCVVTQLKTPEKDGYSAIQVGYGAKKKNAVSKPAHGHFKKSLAEAEVFPAVLREIRDYEGEVEVGSKITCEVFSEGDTVFVQGISKGKGFQGGVKRYGFHGGRKTHGSTFHRSTGSVGAGTYPGRVIKGKKMPGHMGSVTVTTKNLKVVRVEPDKNLIYILGAVPGPNLGNVYIYAK